MRPDAPPADPGPLAGPDAPPPHGGPDGPATAAAEGGPDGTAAPSAHVLLLRGVGGRTQIEASLLRALLRAEGFDRVRVHGHTGNAVFLADLPAAEVARRAGEALIREAGFYNGFQLVAGADWARIVAENPFPAADDDPATLHVAVLGGEPDPRRLEALARLAGEGEALVRRGRAVYLHVPRGFPASRMATRFDRGIGVACTARSWRAARRLLEIVEQVRAPGRPHPLAATG